MADWTIQIESNSVVALSSLGVELGERHDVSLGADTVELRVTNGDVFSTNDFTYLDSVVIFRDGVRWFTGTVTNTIKEGDDGAEGESIRISGPWWWLTQIVYQQDWAVWDQDTVNPGVSKLESNSPRSRVLLGVDSSGNPLSTSAQISAVLSYAVTNSAPLTVGTISLGSILSWSTEAKNETCANIIRNLMAWHPDGTTSFDYSTATPTINIAVPSVVRSFAIGDINKLKYDPRPDLKANGVVFTYERTHDVDGQSFPDPVRDTAGPSTNGPGVIISTIPFEGRSRTTQKQRLRVRTIPTASSSVSGSNTDLEWWWQSKIPALLSVPGGSTLIPKTDFAIDGHTIVMADDVDGAGVAVPLPAPVNPNATVVGAPSSASDLPRELIDGSVEDWMDVKVGRLVVSAAIVYTGSDPAIASRFPERVVVNGKTEPAVEVSVEITGTDGTNKLYSKVVSSKPAETVPTGLAQAYYDSLQNIEHQGRATIVDENLATVGAVGEAIKITDGATTLVPSVAIQEVTRNIEKGETTLIFGPNERLSPQDFFEKLRMQRFVPKTRITYKEKEQGEEPGDSPESVGSFVAPKTNTTQLPPDISHQDRGFRVSLEAGGKVSISDGILTEDGDTEHAITDGSFSSKTVSSGSEDLWVYADTDETGSITGTGTQWGSKPTGLQKHREPETDSLDDAGQSGKYAWKVLTLTNTSGKISWIRHLTSIQYYSDRSAKNWAAAPDHAFSQPPTGEIIPQGFYVGLRTEDNGDCTKLYGTRKVINEQDRELLWDEDTADQTSPESILAFKGHSFGSAEPEIEIGEFMKCGADISPITINDTGGSANEGSIEIIDDRPEPDATFNATKEPPAPSSGTKYKTRCIDSSGNTAWADTDAVPASEYPPDPNAAAHIADQANPHNVGADQVGESATRKWFTPAEQTKLTGIESGATADQTGAEIKTAYESQANTNAFTDSEQGKLASIDATHYGSPVQSTAALAAISGPTDKQRRYVEDELSDYFFDSTATSGDVAPNSGSGYWKQVAMGGETSTSIKTKYESNANTNAFTDTEQAKLSSLDAAHATRLDNPHAVTKAQVGLGSVDNTSDLNKPISTLVQSALSGKANSSALTTHIADAANPHSVTKAQVGLGNADDTSDLDKPLSTATAIAITNVGENLLALINDKASTSALTTHIADTNPHSVTKAQVGLANVDDTSDLAKPISTATQSALDTKASTSALTAHTHTGTQIETWYNSQVPAISAGEITAGTETAIRRVSPKLLKDFVDEHGGAGASSGLTAHIAGTSNPHNVTKAQVGLGNADNTSDLDKPISTLIQSALNGKANSSTLTTHIADTANPHSVTKAQVGLGNADNTSDLDKPLSTATANTITAVGENLLALINDKASTSALTAHTADVANPHSVTKTQIGLGNADNTSDLDKPISALTQSALNGKANSSALTAHISDVANPHTVTKVQVGLGSVDDTSDLDKPISTLVQAALDGKVSTSVLTAHTGNTTNPHSVTKAQVGLGDADNTSDLAKPISTLTQSALNGKLNTSTFTAHSTNTNNPHNTNATDVGLGNVNNTSDLAKPISTLTQAALDNKASTSALTAHINDSDPHGLSVLTNPPNSSIVKNLQVVNGVISWV